MEKQNKFKVPFNFLEERMNSLTKITTSQEREALLVDDDEDIRKILQIMTDLIPINDLEAELFLLKIREISVGEDIDYIMTCSDCQTMNNFKVNVSDCWDLSINSYENEEYPVGLFTSLESIINNTILEDMSLIEISKLEEFLNEQNDKIYDPFITKTCRKCDASMLIHVDARAVISNSNLSELYKDYINISMFTNNGKLDIDSLYPFEREIFVNLISDKMKDDTT